MTKAEFLKKSVDFDHKLKALGFDSEWGMVFGMMIGRLGTKCNNDWDKVDDLVQEMLSLMKVMGDFLTVEDLIK